MTSTDAPSSSDTVVLRELGSDGGDRGRRRRPKRQPAPKANGFWRFVFPLVLVGLGVATFTLWRDGTKAVLDSTDGTLIEVVSDPSAPGYEAFVEPTPTMLVLHTDADDRLVGATVLARTLLDNGGQGVLLSADLAANGLGGATLADRYAADGADAVERSVGTLFGFGFVETLVVSSRDLGLLFGLVEPIALNVLDDLVAVDENGETQLYLAAGGKRLDGEVAAEVYGFRNPGEADANRNERQLDLWESWLLAIGQADDLDAAVLPFEDGLSPYLRAFVLGQHALQIAPAAPTDTGLDQPIYTFDDEGWSWLVATAERMTPLPIAPLGSDLASVRLLDGTGDRRLAQASLDELAHVVEITIVGNAIEFGVTQTTVSYHDQSAADTADELARRIGGVAVFDPRPEDPVDLTVVIGTDWEAP